MKFEGVSVGFAISEVVEFIGELFGLFDELTDKHEVYKVETVGDAYIAGQAEAPLTFKNSPLCVVQKTNKWSRDRKEQVSCRVGVHSGECIGGIVGTEMQRYHLFGKLMTEVEVLESTAPEGRVQVSRACKDAVDKQLRLEGMSESLMFEERSEETLRTLVEEHLWFVAMSTELLEKGSLQRTAMGLISFQARPIGSNGGWFQCGHKGLDGWRLDDLAEEFIQLVPEDAEFEDLSPAPELWPGG
eukprot:s1730_g1.t1